MFIFSYYLIGVGRIDSSWYYAQFCTYTCTFSENFIKKILFISTLDKRQTDKKNVNLEKAGIIRGLNEIQEQDLNVTEGVTDDNFHVGAVLSMYKYLK